MFSRLPQSEARPQNPQNLSVPAVVYQVRHLVPGRILQSPAQFVPHNFGVESAGVSKVLLSHATPLDDII